MDAWIDFRDIVRAAGLEQNIVTRIRQDRHQRQHIFLEQRLATSDLDERTIERRDKIDNLLQRLLFAFVKCVVGVAIIAAQIAESQPHKNTTLPDPGAFTLDRLINLVDRQRLFAHSLGIRNITGRIFASPRQSWSVFEAMMQDKHRQRGRR